LRRLSIRAIKVVHAEPNSDGTCRLRIVGSFTLLAMVLAMMVACGPKPIKEAAVPVAPQPARIYEAPTELTAEPAHERIDLAWKTNRSASTIISGYGIYVWTEGKVADTANGGFRRINAEPYPGDTDGDIANESHGLTDLKDGVIYRIYVTTIYPDGTESPKSNIVETIPRPKGSFTLRESFAGKESGFSFRKNMSVPTDSPDNDIYLAYMRGTLWVASPGRINVVLRGSKFFNAAESSALDKTDPVLLSGQSQDALPVSSHSLLVVQDQSRCYALLRIDSVDFKAKVAKISFIYQPRPETLTFH